MHMYIWMVGLYMYVYIVYMYLFMHVYNINRFDFECEEMQKERPKQNNDMVSWAFHLVYD